MWIHLLARPGASLDRERWRGSPPAAIQALLAAVFETRASRRPLQRVVASGDRHPQDRHPQDRHPQDRHPQDRHHCRAPSMAGLGSWKPSATRQHQPDGKAFPAIRAPAPVMTTIEMTTDLRPTWCRAAYGRPTRREEHDRDPHHHPRVWIGRRDLRLAQSRGWARTGDQDLHLELLDGESGTLWPVPSDQRRCRRAVSSSVCWCSSSTAWSSRWGMSSVTPGTLARNSRPRLVVSPRATRSIRSSASI
jgi:hypothetical protein